MHRPFGSRPRPERFKRDALATPLPGPGLFGRGPCRWDHVAGRVDRDRPGPGSGRRAASRPEPSAPPADVATETVDLLEAGKAGDLTVVAHGQGQDKVQMTIRNTTKRRLNVIIPPGLVAASKVAQAGGGGGGRLQSIGLGSVTNREGAFGEFQADAPAAGLRSIPATGEAAPGPWPSPPGESIDVSIPGVCLNYGLPAPTGRDTLTVMDVDTYTTDPRIRKALRSLATLGTSHGVAQAVMWHLCNDLPFELMLEQSGKVMNAIGDRPGRAVRRGPRRVDGAGSASKPSALTESRIFVQVEGQGPLASEAQRLNVKLDGPPRPGPADQGGRRRDDAPLLGPGPRHQGDPDRLQGRRDPRADRGQHARPGPTPGPPGNVAFRENSSVSVLDGPDPGPVIDRAVAGAFVSVKPARRPWAARPSRSRTAFPSPSRTWSCGPATRPAPRRCRSRPSASGRPGPRSCRSRRPPPRWSSTSSSTAFERRSTGRSTDLPASSRVAFAGRPELGRPVVRLTPLRVASDSSAPSGRRSGYRSSRSPAHDGLPRPASGR